MKRVVLTPELLVRGLREAAAFRGLEAWRDGRIRPVVNRDLARHYVRALRAAGLGPVLLRRWLWWLGDDRRSEFRPDLAAEGLDGCATCDRVAVLAGADGVVHSDGFRPPDGGCRRAPWVPVSRFLG